MMVKLITYFNIDLYIYLFMYFINTYAVLQE